jgi:Calcineurin-like phosphoesterase
MSPRLHSWRRAERRLACALVLAAAGAAAAWAGVRSEVAGAGARRLVAIGDIHGAFNGVREILRKVELIDHDDQWVGGDAILVQTGDFLDRGPGATKVARLLMDLQQQAPEQGGEVIVLLGNHEVLNLFGDLRDVTKYILRNHVDGHSEKRLTVSCNAYAAHYRRLAGLKREKPPKRTELIERCRAEQLPGLVEYLAEIGPDGHIGRWLRTLPVVARVGDVVFVHGGISSELAGRDLEEINREARREIWSFDRTRQDLIDRQLILPTSTLPEIVTVARQLANAASGSPTMVPPSAELLHLLEFNDWLVVREDGPTWFRGYAKWSDEEGAARMPGILAALGAGHVVVGHTPQPPYQIRSRFDSSVFLIDTGMLTSFYNGHPSALEIQDGSFTAFYLTRQDLLHEQRKVAQAR